uniref:Uncharacterized protein n=1 Tax=Rhizophora mucronata TaxID=61149 RepID=A0A2P2IY23_RHIMU
MAILLVGIVLVSNCSSHTVTFFGQGMRFPFQTVDQDCKTLTHQ